MATQYIQDKKGSTFIASSQRPDGSWRKPRRVKEGFVPQEEVPLYESKGKKIAKENQANEGLPVGLTREAWEKMKEARAKLMNPQQKAAKKSNKKSNAGVQNDNVDLNNIHNSEQVAASKKKKNKNKQSNENNPTVQSDTVSSTSPTSTPVADNWVTMGKAKPGKKASTTASLDKATSAVENLRLDNKKGKQQPAKKRIDQLPVSKGVDELANDMLIDEDHDDDNEETKVKEKNNEKHQLVKKIKTLRKKLKDIETLKELSKQQDLDKEQKEKVSKADQFAKELTKSQAKLDQINSGK